MYLYELVPFLRHVHPTDMCSNDKCQNSQRSFYQISKFIVGNPTYFVYKL